MSDRFDLLLQKSKEDLITAFLSAEAKANRYEEFYEELQKCRSRVGVLREKIYFQQNLLSLFEENPKKAKKCLRILKVERDISQIDLPNSSLGKRVLKRLREGGILTVQDLLIHGPHVEGIGDKGVKLIKYAFSTKFPDLLLIEGYFHDRS